MKPDKHKKKKSEQYIKKHNGLGGGSRSIEEVHEQRKQDRASVICGKGQHIESPTESRHLASTGFQKSEYLNDAGTDKTKYVRRKVESNWKKYEVDSGYVEEETIRGANYSELVQFHKYVSPEFQFDNFSDSSCETAASAEKDDFTKHVSLDCEMLSLALRCVPLCQRLEIDESLFDECELEAFRKDSLNQLKGYQAFLEGRNAAPAYGGNGIDSSHTLVVAQNKETSCDLVDNPSIGSLTLTTNNHCTDEVMPSGLQSTHVNSGSELNRLSQKQIDAPVQASADTGLIPEPTEENLSSDSFCKQPELTAHSSESGAAVAKADEKPTAACNSVKDLPTDAISLAELEDDLDSLLAFDKCLPAPLCIYG